MGNPIITGLEQIKVLAESRRDEFTVMRYMLERDAIPDEALDALVEQVAAPIIAAIDCVACNNCCRSLDVYLTPDDAERLSAGLMIPLDAVMTRYIDRDSAQVEEEWGMFRESPCAFLQGNGACSVYAHRPETCRAYPALTPDFRWMLPQLLDGAALCPILYNVFDRMVIEAERLSFQED